MNKKNEKSVKEGKMQVRSLFTPPKDKHEHSPHDPQHGQAPGLRFWTPPKPLRWLWSYWSFWADYWRDFESYRQSRHGSPGSGPAPEPVPSQERTK